MNQFFSVSLIPILLHAIRILSTVFCVTRMELSDSEDYFCDQALSQYEMEISQSTLPDLEPQEEIIFEEIDQRRFVQPITDEELDSLSEKRIPVNTRRNMRWSVNAFESWRKARNNMCSSRVPQDIYDKYHISTIKLEAMSDEQYNDILGKFISESRKKNGDRYPASSLFQLISSIQGYLRMKGRNVSLIKDGKYKKLQDALDYHMKVSTKVLAALNQNESKQADIVQVDTEETLWEEAILGSDNADQLLYTLMYMLGYSFALRASEHKALKINQQISIHIDENGREYLQYAETTSKGYDGGLKSMKRMPRCSRAYANTANSSRCPVALYRKYITLCPVERRPDDFYLQPLNSNQRKPHLWYARRPVGIHKIEGFLRNMTERINVPGRFTPHSLRATNASRLYHHGLEEQLIQEQTGHSSLAVRKYKRTSSDQKVMVSKILQNPSKKRTINPFQDNEDRDSGEEFQVSKKSLLPKTCKASATVSRPPSAGNNDSSETLPTLFPRKNKIPSFFSVDNSNVSSSKSVLRQNSSTDSSSMSRENTTVQDESTSLPFYGPEPKPEDWSTMSWSHSILDRPLDIDDLSNIDPIAPRSTFHREIRVIPESDPPSIPREAETNEMPKQPDIDVNVDAIKKTVSIQIRFN